MHHYNSSRPLSTKAKAARRRYPCRLESAPQPAWLTRWAFYVEMTPLTGLDLIGFVLNLERIATEGEDAGGNGDTLLAEIRELGR